METYFDGEQLRAARDRRPAAHGGDLRGYQAGPRTGTRPRVILGDELAAPPTTFRCAYLDRAAGAGSRRDSVIVALAVAIALAYLGGWASALLWGGALTRALS